MMGRKRCSSQFNSLITIFLFVFLFTNPVLASDDLKEVLYAITLNGELVSEGTIVLQKGEGNFFIEEADLRQWRIRLPEKGVVKFKDKTFYLLNELEGIKLSVDAPTQSLRIEVLANLFVKSVLKKEENDRLEPVHGAGGFFNYDLTAQKRDGTEHLLDGLFEAGLFNRFGVITSNFISRDLGRVNSIIRLDTLWTVDDVVRRQSFRIGDSFNRGGTMGRPVRYGGVQWATNFSIDPGFITFPTPSISGLADRSSVVDVYVNNIKSLSKQTPAGPFDLYNVPVTTGKGEVSLVVKDLLGREQVVTVPYYASPSLLRKGLSDFSYEAGFRRNQYSTESNDYDNFLVSGTHRYGLSDTFTGEIHLEVEKDIKMASIACVWLHPSFGVFSIGIAGSHGDEGSGQQGLLGYDYVSRRFNFGVNTRQSTSRFGQVGLDDQLPFKYQTLIRFGINLNSFGSLGFTFTQQKQFESEETKILTGSYNMRLWKGHLNLTGFRSFTTESDYGFTATYTIPLGKERTLTTYGSLQKDNYNAGVEFQKSLPSSQTGYAYRVRAEKNEDFENFYGNIIGQSEWGKMIVDVSRVGDLNSYRGDLSGSFGVLDGNIFASRWLYQSFGIAQVAEYKNVRVYRSNMEVGKTDSHGYRVVPDLLPYYSNSIRIEEEDLPVDCKIGGTTVTAVPCFRSGMTVRFPVRPVRSATVTVVRPDNTFLPAGTVLRLPDVREELYIALKGQAYLTDLPEGEIKVEADTGKEMCTFTLNVPRDLSSIPDLGKFVCK